MRHLSARWTHRLLTLAMVALLVVPFVALADNVENSVLTDGTETFTIGGPAAKMYYKIEATSAAGDVKGCNCDSTYKTTVRIVIPEDSGVSADPGTLEFDDCGIWKPVQFTGTEVGHYEINVKATGGKPDSSYHVTPAKFKLKVVAASTPDNTTPVVTAPVNQTANEGASTGFDLGSFSDPDNGPWAVSVNWGDGTAPTGFEATTAGSLGTRPHTYADNGEYTVTVRVTDSGSLFGEATFKVNVANVAPTATFNAPTEVDEGSLIALSLTDANDVSSADMAAGFQYAFACGNGYGGWSESSSCDCPTTDDGALTVKGKIKDKDGGEREYTADVTVNNVAPKIVSITGPVDPVIVGTPINLSASFTDPGVLDTHTAVWDWGDGSTETLSLELGARSVTGSHTYAAVGAYTVRLTVTDKDGSSATEVVTYKVSYDFRLLFDNSKPWKLGRTIPIKIQLVDANGNAILGGAAVVTATSFKFFDEDVSDLAPQDAGNANPDSNFRYDEALKGYIYNLSTKNLKPGVWALYFTVSGDPTTHIIGLGIAR